MTGENMNSANHECDLFLMSSHTSYHANNILSNFAKKGQNNIDGWGIGFYNAGQCKIIKSPDPVVNGDKLNETFRYSIEASSSPLILGHLRRASRGRVNEHNSHPFHLNFLDYDWLLIHNGTASKNPNEIMSYEKRLLVNSDNDSARVFEFIRLKVIEYYLSSHKHSLISSLKNAYIDLIKFDRNGKFNIIMSNGYLTFIFIHFRPFYYLLREKESGDVSFLSTLKLSEDEKWITFEKLSNYAAKMLVYSGNSLIYNDDLIKGNNNNAI